MATSSAQPDLVVGPTRTLSLAHLINATANRTLETSDLRYFSVIDVSQHPEWSPRAGTRLLFFARRSVRGQPGAPHVLRSLSTWMLAPSASNNRLELLSEAPSVNDYALASNLEVFLAGSMLLGLGGHHLGWDERRGYSKLGRHESNGRRLRPRDGLHLLKGTRLADVLNGAWLPWSQFIPADITTPAESAAVSARKASIIIDGRHPGCSERFNRYAPTCYFDSKMSLARFKGKFLVFARANTVERGGGRFVQVAESAGDDPGGPYGRFEMITIEGYTDIRSGNIYTAVVREHPLEPRMLLGLFSVNEGQPGRVNKDGKCYIALSLSCDGRRWSRLVPLIPTAGEKGRTFDQPVGGLVRRGASVHFYVQRDVPQISAAAPTESRLERYTFRGSALRQLTAAAKARICPWA